MEAYLVARCSMSIKSYHGRKNLFVGELKKLLTYEKILEQEARDALKELKIIIKKIQEESWRRL